MTYICHDCGFIFQRTGMVSECPGCEKKWVRPATEAEGESLLEMLRGETKELGGKDII